MIRLAKWITTPLTPRYKSTSPASIIGIVTIMVLIRNIPLSENIFNVNDLFFWLRTNAGLIFVCWLSTAVIKKQPKGR